MLETTSSTDPEAHIAQLESQLQEREALLTQRIAEIQARDLRIRLLEEALRVLQAGASREKLGQAPGQRSLFNEAKATIEVTEAVGIEPELAATPDRSRSVRQTRLL